MALITITITESEDQVVSGKPKYLILEADIPCNIYYTYDESDPTTMSDIYIDKLYLPYEDNTLVVKIFATNGSDESEIIEKIYSHEYPDNVRRPRSNTDARSEEKSKQLYPLGTSEYNASTKYSDFGSAGLTVYDPELEAVANGFNYNGEPDGYTNLEFNTLNYKIVYNAKGVGNFPAEVTFKQKKDMPEESYADSAMFDPKAFVIFVDQSKINPEDPPIIGTQFFSFESPTTYDGSKLYSSGLDSPTVNGTYIRSFYDPRTNTMTSYYRDSAVNRWMIIKSPYKPKNVIDNLTGFMLGGNSVGKHVYKWVPYIRRTLG